MSFSSCTLHLLNYNFGELTTKDINLKLTIVRFDEIRYCNPFQSNMHALTNNHGRSVTGLIKSCSLCLYGLALLHGWQRLSQRANTQHPEFFPLQHLLQDVPYVVAGHTPCVRIAYHNYQAFQNDTIIHDQLIPQGEKSFTLTQKSGLHHPDDSLKNVMVFSALASRSSVAGTAFVEDGHGPCEEACLRLQKEVCEQFQWLFPHHRWNHEFSCMHILVDPCISSFSFC